eukprot:11255649-Prorocentrum_lima.AAC.1
MPTPPALPPPRSQAVQVELFCHMMKIMQEQGRAVGVHCSDNFCHEQQPVRRLRDAGNLKLYTV